MCWYGEKEHGSERIIFSTVQNNVYEDNIITTTIRLSSKMISEAVISILGKKNFRQLSTCLIHFVINLTRLR